MLQDKEIINLLKGALKSHIKCLEKNDFAYLEYKGQIIAYINVLNKEGLKIRYLDINKAKEILKQLYLLENK